MTTPTCEVCGKELPYSGRGRPPTKCEEHKKSASKNGNKEGEPSLGTTRPRPRPGQKPSTPPAEEKKAETKAPTPPPVGSEDTGSRAKAEAARKRSESQLESVDSETWPRGQDGRPMAKITMTASELIPTGQYANVSIGPAQITAFVDLDRKNGDGYFTEEERGTLVRALNELAEVVERDVISVQRSLVLESMQEQLSS